MKSKAKNVNEYLKEVPEDRKAYFLKLRNTPNTVTRNWIWEKAVSALKNPNKYHLN